MAEPCDLPVWTRNQVMDAISNATRVLLGSGLVRPDVTDAEVRAAVTVALTTAGIEEGATR